MRTITVAALFTSASLLLPAASAAQDDRFRDALVRCESKDGKPRQCAADVRGEVRLLRQLSRSECIEDRTWGATRRGVWVSEGCRGEFLVSGWRRGGRAAPVSDFLRCESKDGRSNHCPAETHGGVELVRQLSRSPCIRGQSWGWNPRGVWVTGGCRAEFRTLGFDRDDFDRDVFDGRPAVTRCESIDGGSRHCRADTRGGVRMKQQLSKAACIEGRTWGYDRDGIWVEAGCRADFEAGGYAGSGWVRGER